MESEQVPKPDFSLQARWALGLFSGVGLVLVFLFQRINWALLFQLGGTSLHNFLINRSVRFMLNDVLAVLLVAALFGKKQLVWIAVIVQLFGLVFILIPYLILKVQAPHYNGPLISFLHRLILNPLLIYLLIFFFWYQQNYTPAQPNK